MHHIRIGTNTYDIPSTWAELTPVQARAIGPYLAHDTKPNRVAIVCILSGDKKRMGRDLTRAAKELAGWYQPLLDVVGWLWERRSVSQGEPLVPIIPGMKWRAQEWLLPKPDLADVTLNEWAFIEAYMAQIAAKSDPMAAVKLFFTVCRPARPKSETLAPDYDGYPRRHFNPQLIDHQAETVKRIPVILLRAAVDYASRAQEWLPMRYPRVFARDGKKGSGFGTLGIIMSLADGGTFGVKSEVERVNIHEAFVYLTKNIMEAEARERASQPNSTFIR